MPYILQDYVIETPPQKEAPKIKRPAFSFSNLDTDIKPEILKAVFKLQKEQAYTECWRNIKNSIEKITGEKIGDNKAKDSLACFLATEEIIKVDPPKGKPVYVLKGQKSIDFE